MFRLYEMKYFTVDTAAGCACANTNNKHPNLVVLLVFCVCFWSSKCALVIKILILRENTLSVLRGQLPVDSGSDSCCLTCQRYVSLQLLKLTLVYSYLVN